MLTSRLADQLATVERLAPVPRRRLGKISELISQNTGPMLMANETM